MSSARETSWNFSWKGRYFCPAPPEKNTYAVSYLFFKHFTSFHYSNVNVNSWENFQFMQETFPWVNIAATYWSLQCICIFYWKLSSVTWIVEKKIQKSNNEQTEGFWNSSARRFWCWTNKLGWNWARPVARYTMNHLFFCVLYTDSFWIFSFIPLFPGNLTAAIDIDTLQSRSISHILTVDSCALPCAITERPGMITKFLKGMIYEINECKLPQLLFNSKNKFFFVFSHRHISRGLVKHPGNRCGIHTVISRKGSFACSLVGKLFVLTELFSGILLKVS